MCGICGFMAHGEAVLSGRRLQRAVKALGHRGPDSQGLWGVTAAGKRVQNAQASDAMLSIALGHARLAVFDTTDAGAQPMAGPEGLMVAHNGEIYNFRDLRSALKPSFSFDSQSDTEVLLAAWAKDGEHCLPTMNGMWAFAMADTIQGRITLCRDRLGVKPLYYAQRAEGVYFASEPAALFELLGETPRINPTQLARWVVFRESDDGDSCLFEGIHALPGGTLLTIENGKALGVRPWWQLPQGPDLQLGDTAALDAFEEIFEDSVRLRLQADRPVGILLSGGVDSAAVTLAASRVGAQDIVCVTSSFPDMPDIDETEAAARVAAHCGAQHMPMTPELGDVLNSEAELSKSQGLPYGSLSLLVHWELLSKVREQGIPVVLSGQGGDELFLGYERYHVSHALSRLPNAYSAVKALLQGGKDSRPGMRGLAAQAVYFAMPEIRRRRLLSQASSSFRVSLLSLAGKGAPMAHSNKHALQAHEITGPQLGQLLRYDDRTSAGQGMETRLPFLDWRLVEFAYRLPWNHCIRAGWGKHLVRRYLDRHGLGSTAWNKHKKGFEAPQGLWQKHLVNLKGQELGNTAMASRLLRTGTSLESLPPRSGWDAYNILHLAALGGWNYS